uniref:trypsin n=1 Tax=Anopheles atroparvus TaxID=41427 RepID=A0A182IXU4_ANOAO
MWTGHILAVLLLAFCVLQTRSDEDHVNYIVGGEVISITEAPYQAVLLFKLKYFCGGAIIAPVWILTAAHCLSLPSGNLITAGLLKVRLGADDANIAWGNHDYDVVGVMKHPGYNASIYNYDIGLLKLARRITYGPRIQCIKMPEVDTPIPYDEHITVTGYGITNTSIAPIDAKLRVVDLTIMDPDLCILHYQLDDTFTITNRMFCASGKDRDACKYDAGGPAEYHNRVIGITSHGRGCAEKEFPGIYAKVSKLRPWVDAVLKANTRKQSNAIVHSKAQPQSRVVADRRMESSIPSVLLLLAVVAIACLPTHCAAGTSNDDNLANLIVGGFKVSIEEVPYQVGVFRDHVFRCGGTIIGRFWIVTAQHCIPDTRAYRYEVVVGVDVPENGQRLPVAEVYLPPNNADGSTFDVSLAKLGRGLHYSSRVACLPLMSPSKRMYSGTPAYISGYGMTNLRSLDTQLRAATVALMGRSKCVGFYREQITIRPYHFCAGFEGGLVDSCQGDSGGPLVVNGELAGVTDMGVGCARAHAPGIYITVGSFYNWLMEIVGEQRNLYEQKLCAPNPPSI